MRILQIHENDANQRVDKFLSKALPTLPKNLMYKYIRNKKIKVNKKRCEISQRLQVGDELQCYISEEFFLLEKDASFLKASINLAVLYEDQDIIIMNKEVGLLAHSDDKISDDTLVNRLKHYLYEKKEYDHLQEQSFAPSLCHRIDRNTQGIVIGAKNAQALRDMNKRIHDGLVHKKYQCIVEGHMPKQADTLYLYHKKENQEVFISDVALEGYKQIKTGYKVLRESSQFSLLEIDLFTGKSHQIRAVMAYLKHPLYGDSKYGAKRQSYPYQALCAYQVYFDEVEDSISQLNHKSFVVENIDFISFLE